MGRWACWKFQRCAFLWVPQNPVDLSPAAEVGSVTTIHWLFQVTKKVGFCSLGPYGLVPPVGSPPKAARWKPVFGNEAYPYFSSMAWGGMQPATSRTDALSDVDGLTAHMSEMLNFSETSNVLPIVGMCEKVGWFQIWVVFRPYLGWMIEITSISVFLCTVFLYYICGMEKHQPESTFYMTWWHRSGHASWCQALEMLRLGTPGTSRAIPCHSPEIFTPGPGNTQGTLNLW